MKESSRYLLWAALLCLLLSVFSVAMILVNIKPLSIPMMVTTVVLIVATVVLFILYHGKRR